MTPMSREEAVKRANAILVCQGTYFDWREMIAEALQAAHREGYEAGKKDGQ